MQHSQRIPTFRFMQRSLESTCHCLDGLEVSVVVREHPKWGEHPHPMAFVILYRERAKHWVGKHIELTPELKAHTRERLPGFAVLEWVAVVEELPVCHVARPLLCSYRRYHTPENDHREDPEDSLATTNFRKSCSLGCSLGY